MGIWEPVVNFLDIGIITTFTQGKEAKVIFHLFWKAGELLEVGKSRRTIMSDFVTQGHIWGRRAIKLKYKEGPHEDF